MKTCSLFGMLIGYILLITVSTQAAVLPSNPGGCAGWGWEPCIGQYTLNDLGSFDGSGIWIWAQDFVSAADAQLSCSDQSQPCIYDWQTNFMPFKDEFPMQFISKRLDRSTYVDPSRNHTRVSMVIVGAGKATMLPQLWLSNCTDPSQPPYQAVDEYGNLVWLSVEVECPEVYNPAIQYNFFMNWQGDNVGFEPVNQIHLPFSIQSLEWDETGEIGELNFANKTDTAIMTGYNGGMRFWNPANINKYGPAFHWKFKSLPELGSNNFTLTLGDGAVHNFQFTVQSVDAMPNIPATFTQFQNVVTKSGKTVKGLENIEVTVKNILVREVDDPIDGKALVIQWAEPDGALFGGRDLFYPSEQYQLKVVARKFARTADDSREVYLLYDCPAQLGTAVIDADAYELLKSELLNSGFDLNDIEINIHYREHFQDEANDTIYQNRGYSDSVFFTPSQ